jgi:plasmid stabilization system protein ParE
MIYKVVLTPQAESDIEDSFTFIANGGSPKIAAKWLRKLKSEIASLSEMPNRCSMSPEAEKFGVELRQLIFGKANGTHRIIYRIDEPKLEVHVIAVRHTARDEISIEDVSGYL